MIGWCEIPLRVQLPWHLSELLLGESSPFHSYHIQHPSLNVMFHRQIIQSTEVGVCLWACLWVVLGELISPSTKKLKFYLKKQLLPGRAKYMDSMLWALKGY